MASSSTTSSSNSFMKFRGRDRDELETSSSSFSSSYFQILYNLGTFVTCYTAYQLLYKYYKYKTNPLRLLPGPRDGWFWLGQFIPIVKAEFMAPHKDWWQQAGMMDTAMMSYSTLLGRYSVIVLDADILQLILTDPSSSKENSRFPKRYIQLHYMLGDGLVTLEGPDWSRHRRIIQPSFQTSVLERTLDETVPGLTRRLVQCWKKGGKDKVIDANSHLSALTLDAIGQAGFSYDFNALDAVEEWANENKSSIKKEDELVLEELLQLPEKEMCQKLRPVGEAQVNHPFAVAFRNRLKPSIMGLITALLRIPTLERYLLPGLILRQEAFDKQATLVVQQAKEKLLHQSKTDNKSLLQLLINANNNNNNAEKSGTGKQQRTSLSDLELRDETKTFLLAGHETTSTWCYWALYALVRNPDIEEKVYQDVVRYSEGKKLIGLEQVNKMEYLAAFLNEVLRYYPPVGLLIRNTTQKEKWKGCTIPDNTRIVIPIQLIHRSPKYWGPDAEEFKPERWLDPEVNRKRHAFCFIPFSAGGRNCIGYKFARIEATIIMAQIIQEFKIRAAPCMPDKVRLTSFLTTTTKPLLKICVEERLRETAAQ